MAVKFILGRSGTGKSRRCIDSIVDAITADPLGPPIFWIVPRQATFAAERELTCNTKLGGYFRARVVSFEQLGREILAECGGSSVPEITPLGRQMLIGHLLRQHADELKYFRTVARQPGLAAQLDETFSEFEAAGKDPSELDNLLRAADASDAISDDVLLDKLHDLQLIYRAYSQHLGQERFDQFRRLNEVLKCIASASSIQKAIVFCDDFRTFSEYERQVLAALGKSCESVTVTFTIDPSSVVLKDFDQLPDDHSLFHPIEMTYRRLRITFREQGVPVDDPPEILHEVRRFQSPALQRLEKYAFDRKLVIDQSNAAGIEFTDAPTRSAEVDAAARRILELTREGHRFREIALLARDIIAYEDLIALSFREHNIPYFTDRRRSMSHRALPRLLRSIATLARGRWPHDAMMDLLKTGLTNLNPDQADELENYVLHHRLRGDAWSTAEPWNYQNSGLFSKPEAQAVGDAPGPSSIDESRRRLIDPLKKFISIFSTAPTLRTVAAALFDLLESFQVRQRLRDWINIAEHSSNFVQSAEHQQVWTEIVQLFEEMTTLLGGEPVTADDFAEILDAGLESFALALTPPSLDQVLVGQIDRTRMFGIKAVLVLGLNDGVFPHVPRDDSVLNDGDRKFFSQRQLDLTSSTSRRFLDEHFLAYYAFTRPSELLCLSRSRSDASGKPLTPCQYWLRLSRMFPNAKRTSIPRQSHHDPRYIATPRQLVSALSQWVRSIRDENTIDPESAWPALYQRFLERRNDPRFAGWRALSYRNEATLSPEIAARLFQPPLETTASQIESFAACAFKHFTDRVLALRPRDTDDVSAMDLGNVYHGILERIVRSLLKKRQDWSALSTSERDRLIRQSAAELGQKLRGEILLSSARNRYLLNRIERTLSQVVDTQKTTASRGRMKPKAARVSFGKGQSLPVLDLTTPRGHHVNLSGKIDRVDLNESSNEAVTIDYRMSSGPLSLADVYHGLELQLLTSLLVLEAHGELLTGQKLTPTAAFYVKTIRRIDEVEHPAAALSLDDEAKHLESKPRGIVSESIVAAIDRSLQNGASEVINCHIKKDGTFGAKSKSDLASPEELTALLAHMRLRIGQLADDLLSGQIAIRPYLLGQTSPCPRCSYQIICRFDPSQGYRVLTPMKREDVLRVVVHGEEAAHG